MSKEFAKFIEKLNKKSLEEQVKELQKVIAGLVDITEKFVNYYDMNLSKITNKLIKIETNQMRSKLPKIEVLSTLPSPPSHQRPIGRDALRTIILGELKDLFKEKE